MNGRDSRFVMAELIASSGAGCEGVDGAKEVRLMAGDDCLVNPERRAELGDAAMVLRVTRVLRLILLYRQQRKVTRRAGANVCYMNSD